MTTTPLAAAAIAHLEAEGVDTVIGTVVSPAGLTQAKVVPIRRTNTFAETGLGASPVWNTFAIDQRGVVFTDDFGVVGDQRFRIDLPALRIIGAGLAWAPGSLFDQDGAPLPVCSRGTLGRVEASLAAAGLQALVGHEIEFFLVNPDGSRLTSTLWAQYGMVSVLEYEDFIRDVTAEATSAGVGIEQFHAEYSIHQFEISLTPQPPVAAADQLVLARIILGRVARRHGLRVSLSPMPFADDVGCGAHQHFSLTTSEGPVFSGGSGVRGMTPTGESALAGLLRGLPEAQGVLCGSIVSGLRLRPRNWAGAYACWGTENREAALRFIRGGPASQYGANLEVKVVDPSANPYYASGAILGLALLSIDEHVVLPPETTTDPAELSESERDRASIVRLSDSQPKMLAALENSKRLRSILGDPAVDAVVAVRRFEHDRYAGLSVEQLTEKFRMAWSM